jgi:hypothetical protein
MDIRIEFLAVEDEITRKQVPDTVIVSCTGEGHSAFFSAEVAQQGRPPGIFHFSFERESRDECIKR